jgi:stage II sporulation protein D
VDIDNYLAGVVESEGGGGQSLEYYRVQGLMSRTYLLKYINKHSKEGFSMCDRVHCQAYHNMMRFTPTIDEAIKTTQGMVMVDPNNNFADSYFHANCGGQTCEPDYVWNNAIPYLKTFVDTFCVFTKQAIWEKSVPRKEWENYLVKEFHFPIYDSLLSSQLYTFKQDQRKAFYIDPTLGIPLRDLRMNFNLKSTFFSTSLVGENVLVIGRGFGHGVGLCQEGAMKMAKYGYNYKQIAEFYFPGLKVVNLKEISFFGQEPVSGF